MKYFTILMIGVFFLIPNAAQAQMGKKPSSDEDIAIAFYKTGGIQPDLKSWVEKSEEYRNTPLARRDEVMQRELQRLASKYSKFDPEKDFITIQTMAKIKHIEEIDPIEKTSSYFAEITFARGPDAFFFPYVFQENNFAVMPFALDKLLRSPVSLIEYDTIERLSVQNQSYPFTLTMRPREAMTEGPVNIADINQWILKTDIITAEIWRKTGALLWQYTAPDYLSPKTKAIQELYELKSNENADYGIIKPLNMD